MGKKYPVLTAKEVIAILEKLGFSEVRQRGSHKQYRHADVTLYNGSDSSRRDISPILVRQIAKDIELTIEEFNEER
jgi:predicted RNA binding protein YcfA (HicA-like mRNA interferase family)